MFCSQCGAQASGRFCWKCGAPLRAPDAPDAPDAADAPDATDEHPAAAVPPPAAPAPNAPAAPTVDAPNAPAPPIVDTPSTPAPPTVDTPSTPPPPADWSDEVSYAALTAVPEVRDRLARAAAQSRKGMSAEDFMAIGDKLLGPLTGAPVSTSTVVNIVVPIYDRLGVHTGKTREQDLPWPAGRVIVAVLCSLARRGMTIATVHQAQDGCVIEASIPSNAFVFTATLVVTVRRRGPGSSLEAAATAKGQMFDWGRSKATLKTLFEDVAAGSPADVVA